MKKKPYTLKDRINGKPIPPEMLARIENDIIPQVMKLTGWAGDQKSFLLHGAKAFFTILDFVKLLTESPENPVSAMFWLASGDRRGLDSLAASRFFQKRAVFAKGYVYSKKKGRKVWFDRWETLEPHFTEYRQQQSGGKIVLKSFKAAWLEIIKPALLVTAGRPETGEQRLDEVYPFLRRETRKEIEREILHGRTLDETSDEYLRAEAEEEEDDSPEALKLDQITAKEWGRFGQLTVMEVKNLLAKFPEEVITLLGEAEDGLSEEAKWQRCTRAKNKLEALYPFVKREGGGREDNEK